MDINAAIIKEISTDLGADLAGIAPVDRFNESPQGFHPLDVLPSCKSVVVLCCRFPGDTYSDPETYTRVRNAMVRKMNKLATDVAGRIRKTGFDAKPVRSINGSWADGRYRGPISLKHAAVFAGLGVIGRNTLLVNNKYGNMIWLSAVLTSAELEPDPLAKYKTCSRKCNLCINNCPSAALGSEMMQQMSCYKHAFKTAGGKLQIRCWKCREICPNHLGIKK